VFKFTLTIFASAVLAITAACTRPASHPPADEVLKNGKVYTANPSQPWAQAVAIRGGKIVAVADDAAMTSWIGATTRVVDLKGGMLMPGLIDSHVHPLAGGRQMTLADLGGGHVTLPEFKAFVDESIASGKALHDGRAVIVGVHPAMWSENLGDIFNQPPYATRPTLFAGSDSHTAWANKAMLKVLGVSRESLAVMPAEKRKDYSVDRAGEPTGFAVEAGASNLFRGLPGRDGRYDRAWGTSAVRYLNEHGVTALLEANAGHPSSDGEAILTLYQDLAQSGDLTLRVSALLEAQSSQDLPEIYRLREKYSGLTNFSVVGVKLFADGVVDYPAQTAAVLTPYAGTGGTGALKIEPAEMARIVTDAQGHDMLVHIHAIGDRAVRVALDSIEAARKQNPSSTIHHSLAHLHLIAPADVPRFKQLGAVASFQLLWATLDETEQQLIKPYLTPEVWNEQYAARSLADAGAVVAGGSDWPVSSGNPWEAIAQAMTRAGPFGVLNERERVSLPTMLDAYTIGAATAARLEDKVGSIIVGKEADLILLDRNVAALTPAQIAQTKVQWTMLGGRIVYRCESCAPFKGSAQ
jgi:predicted amidohydrolase YtcJ